MQRTDAARKLAVTAIGLHKGSLGKDCKAPQSDPLRTLWAYEGIPESIYAFPLA